MRKLLLVCLGLWFVMNGLAQTPLVDKLIKEGIEHYDNGRYDEAIQRYNRALSLHKSNLAARYELALTYYTKGEYQKAIDNCRMVTDRQSDYWVEAMVVYGASFESLGDSKRAVKIFEEAIAKRPEHARLRYNAALSYFNLRLYDKAEQYLSISIEQDRGNPSAHLLMANITLSKGDKLKSMMALYYFLLLEHDTERSPKALELLQEIWSNLAKSGQRALGAKQALSLKGIKKVEADVAAISVDASLTSDLDVFVARTEGLLKCTHDGLDQADGFWRQYYFDFFNDVAQKGYGPSMAYFAAQSKYKESVMVWLVRHATEFTAFSEWMSAQ